MKKALLIIVPLTALLFASCSKCKVCTKSGEDEVRLCEKDYDSQTEYGLAVDYYEGQGFDCVESY